MFLRSRSLWVTVCVVVFFVIHGATLYNGHNWGDDFAHYILYARNLLAGRPLQDGVTLGLSVFPPPGFSFLLASVVLFCGVDFIALKAINIVCWLGMAAGFHMLISHIDKRWEWQVPLILLCSSYFFIYKQNVLPDIPFACCCVWAIYFFERYRISSRAVHFHAFCFLAGAAFFMRLAGAYLFIAAAAYLLFIRKEPKRLWGLATACLIALVPQQFLTGFGGGDSWSGCWEHPALALRKMAENIPVIFKGLVWIIVPYVNDLIQGSGKALNLLVDGFLVILFLFIVGVFIRRIVSGRSTFVDWSCLCYLIGLVLWGGVFSQDAWTFSRYLLPVTGFALYYGFQAMRRVSSALLSGVLVTILFLNIGNIILGFQFNDDAILTERSREMFTWVREHVPEGTAVMFNPPRVMALMTGRKVSPIWLMDAERSAQSVERWKVRYIIMHKALDGIYTPGLAVRIGLRPVWANDGFVIYEIPGPG